MPWHRGQGGAERRSYDELAEFVEVAHPWGGVDDALELLPTFDAPHFDVLVPKATGEAASILVSLFSPAERNPLPPKEEVNMTTAAQVQIDIPCDIQQVDETGFLWTFLGEARDPSLITEGAIVIAADEIAPVVARVVKLTLNASRTLVHLQILPGDPLDYADALARSHLLTA